MKRFHLSLPWIGLVLIMGWIVLDSARQREGFAVDPLGIESTAAAESVAEAPAVVVDPVCGMEIRTQTAYSIQEGNHAVHFCTTACRDEYLAAPASFALLEEPAAQHTMRGIPVWMYQAGVALLLVLSFGLFEFLAWWGDRRKTRAPSHSGTDERVNLTASRWVTRALRWGPTRFMLQLITVALFLLVIVAGLFGNQNPALNLAPLLTWTIWWAGLIFVVLFFGGSWCTVCPWDAIATWVERLKFWGPRDGNALGLDIRWPKLLRNVWPAAVLFVLLTWVELGMGITLIPRATAWVALGMLGLAVGSVLFFDRKSFCRYGCFVGRITGMYSLFSSLELRSTDPEICASCTTLDCYRGNANGDGCPTFQFPKMMQQSTYCTMCTECIKTCPHENIAIRLRPWGSDLLDKGRPRNDEAWLALLLLALTGFHGLTMTPYWRTWNDALTGSGAIPEQLSFALLMTGVVIGPILLYGLLILLTAAWSRPHKPRTLFVRYAYALLPIALFYHLAHNAEHFLMESPKILALASDPLGWGWNLFGTAGRTFAPLITLEGLWVLQVAFILVGHVYSLWISGKTARSLIQDRSRAFVSQLPMATAMVAFSIFSLWLLKQPMEMRVSGM